MAVSGGEANGRVEITLSSYSEHESDAGEGLDKSRKRSRSRSRSGSENRLVSMCILPSKTVTVTLKIIL